MNIGYFLSFTTRPQTSMMSPVHHHDESGNSNLLDDQEISNDGIDTPGLELARV